MAGFGNVGNVPSLVSSRIEENNVKDTAPLSNEEREEQQRLWDEYASSRPYVAASPGREAASVLIRNRDMIVKDIEKIVQTKSNKFELPAGKDLDATMRSLACILCEERYDENCLEECKSDKHVQQLAAFLDFRMSVPRDMNALSAAYFKRLAVAL
jgi:glutathione S-transferase